MKASELADIYDFEVCLRCLDIMPDDPKKREVMHGEGLCNVREAPTERAKKVLQ